MSAYAGVRIVDFSQGTAGPMASMLLSDLGAEVVKVEPPGGEHLAGRPGWYAFNRNKQVLTLDLASSSDLAEARRLIAGADVAVFDHAPGVLDAMGLGAGTLTADHARLIHAWTPPYGTQGPYAALPARHSLLAGLAGVAFRQGAYGDVPVHMILPLCWYGQGVMGAAAIGAALLERARSGRGQAVTVSGLHGAAEVAGPVRVLAHPTPPRGQPLGATPSYRLYEGSDGQWFFLGTLFANFYARAIEVLGLADHWEALVNDPLAARQILSERFRTAPRDHWVALLRAAGVPSAPVGDRRPWFAGQAVAEAGLRLTFEDAALGPVAIPGPPARLSATPARVKGLPARVARFAWPARDERPAAGSSPTSAPLAGVRVLDLGTVIAGAYAGALLASLGADVVKIEPPEGDPFRSDGGPFLGYNRGKRALGLDLKAPGARDLFLDLARSADVVLDNYRLGVRTKLGIDYPALRAVNPRIVSCSINAYGVDGSWATRPGFDPLLQAEGGMMAAQGGEGEPILHTVAVNDVATAAVTVASIVAALNAREVTGEGQEITTSLLAQSLTFQLAEMVDYAGRPGNDVGGTDCLGVRALTRYYPCADGWLALACETPAEAAAAASVLGVDLGDATQALAAPRDGSLSQALAAAIASRPRDATALALVAAGAPAAPVRRTDDALRDPDLWANGAWEAWRHGRLGDVVGVRGFADFARTPAGFARPTPDIGEHSRGLLEEAGFDGERIARLFADGAVFEASSIAADRAKSARAGDGGSALTTA